MTTEEPILTELPHLPFDKMLQLCLRIRTRQVRATPELRERARAITFAIVYGRPVDLGRQS